MFSSSTGNQIGLTEIGKALQTNTFIIFAPLNYNRIINLDAFLKEIHRSDLRTCIFTDPIRYFEYIQRCQDESLMTSSLILASPKHIIPQVHLFYFSNPKSELLKIGF